MTNLFLVLAAKEYSGQGFSAENNYLCQTAATVLT